MSLPLRCDFLESLLADPSAPDRFNALVDKRGPDECWPWKGSRDKQGYGKFGCAGHGPGKTVLAHRASFTLQNRRVPVGYVLHRCDEPSCVNHGHLFEGTAKDNAQDRASKGRNADFKGERSYNAKLTGRDVVEIREQYATGTTSLKKLAAKYGVTFTCIWQIVARKSWRHI